MRKVLKLLISPKNKICPQYGQDFFFCLLEPCSVTTIFLFVPLDQGWSQQPRLESLDSHSRRSNDRHRFAAPITLRGFLPVRAVWRGRRSRRWRRRHRDSPGPAFRVTWTACAQSPVIGRWLVFSWAVGVRKTMPTLGVDGRPRLQQPGGPRLSPNGIPPSWTASSLSRRWRARPGRQYEPYCSTVTPADAGRGGGSLCPGSNNRWFSQWLAGFLE